MVVIRLPIIPYILFQPAHDMQAALRQRLPRIASWSTGFAQAMFAAVLFKEHVADINPCVGASMYPTLSLEKDWLLTIRMTTVRNLFQRNAPHVSRGDLVEFTSPSDPSYDCCKRVVGIEGDVVCVDPSRENDPDAVDWVKIPPGYLWVAGDNTSHSTDSRTYGPLPLGLVQGKVVARIWPRPRWLTAARDHVAVVQ